MKQRSLLAVVTSLVAATAGLLAASPAEAAGPSGVQTTITLLGGGNYRVAATGKAPAGARVYLQDRFDEHQLWATQRSGRASNRGTFRLVTTTERSGGSYRVCVSRPGKDACSAGRSARIVKRSGDIALSDTASQLIPYETTLVTKGKLSRYLRGLPLTLQYKDVAGGKWQGLGDLASIDQSGKRFDVSFDITFPGLVSKQGLRLRVVAQGNAWVKTAKRGWNVDSYTQRSLAALPVQTGSQTQGNVVYGFVLNSPVSSAAMSPTNTIALTVPAGCGRIQAGISPDLSQPGVGPFSTLVQRNGVTAWSYDSAVPGPRTFSLDVAGGDTVSLTVTFDPAHPEWRPWFVSPFPPLVTAPKLPFALCAAP